MKDLRYLLQMMSRLLISVVMVGCSSKGAIFYSPDTRDDIDGYITETLELVKSTGDSLEVVFYRAGSIEEYAKNVNEHDFKYDRSSSSVKDVTVLMDRSFNQLEADGIEIDGQTIDGSQMYKNVYIVHDKIDDKNLSQMSEAYLENNSQREPPLSLYISTYNLKRKSFFNRLRKDVARTTTDPPTNLKNVRGLIFGIQVWEH